MIARTAQYLHDMVPQLPWRVLLVTLVLGEVRLARGEGAEAERWAAKAEDVRRLTPTSGCSADAPGGSARRSRSAAWRTR